MKTITLTRDLKAKVDDEDYEWLSKHKWYAYRSGRSNPPLYYAGRWGNGGTKILMHREISKAPADKDVDHDNGDTLDNQRVNLVHKTRSQNSHGFRRDTHAMMGITITASGKYRANIMVDYKRTCKNFNSLEEAQAWRRSMKP